MAGAGTRGKTAGKAAGGGVEPPAVTFDDDGNKVPFDPDTAPGGRLAPVREFKTAGYTDGGGDGADGERTELPYKHDGRDLLAYMPTETQVGLVARAGSRTATVGDKVDSYLRFVQDTHDPRSAQYITDRLEDPNDAEFGFKALADIALWLVEAYEEAHPQAPRNGPQGGGRRGGRR